jgi:hypothetical protein
MKMQNMQEQLQQLQGMLLQSEVGKNNSIITKNNADANKIANDSAIQSKKFEHQESLDIANLLLEQQNEDAVNAQKSEELAIKASKVASDILLSRQKLSSDQIDQVLRASEIDDDRVKMAHNHALEVSKHVHEVNIDLAGLNKTEKTERND